MKASCQSVFTPEQPSPATLPACSGRNVTMTVVAGWLEYGGTQMSVLLKLWGNWTLNRPRRQLTGVLQSFDDSTEHGTALSGLFIVNNGGLVPWQCRGPNQVLS